MTLPLSCQALLFDLDGVLVDSGHAVERAWRAWSRRHDLDFDKVLELAHGRRTIETIAAVAPHLDAAAETTAIEEDEVGRAIEVLALPGAQTMLSALPPDRWAVVTSGTRRLSEARMRTCGFPDPRVLVTAEDVSEGKPHPAGYLAAAESLGFDPASCVVFEDAPPGIAAGRATGARVVAVTTTYPPDKLRGADAVAESLEQLRVEASAGGLVLQEA